MRYFIRYAFLLAWLIGVTAYAQNQCAQGDHKLNKNIEHQYNQLDESNILVYVPMDPNEIIGPAGYDDSIRWVSVNDVLNYTVLFENDAEFATASAVKVDVRFTFENEAQMKGFGLGTYGFANMSWPIEDTQTAYQNRLDLRDSMYIYVDLTAGVDATARQAFWTFNSIDPETGYTPWQVDRGMLPVNDSTHVGEGFVKFKLTPDKNLKTGDTISIMANIVFDQNDTVPTNRWRNTIDAGMPTSMVKANQDSKNENLYHLTLQAADDEGGSGLKRVLLYQANNFGIYEEAAVCPLDTVIDFETTPGHQYRFYSIAEDNVGNREPLKAVPDLVINNNAAPTDIALSDSIFKDDIVAGGFIAELSSVDIEEGSFTYALAEGDGAVHNDMFQIKGTQLQAKECFKCAEDSVYKIRISTTDEGGLSFSKAFVLNLEKVLIKPDVDTLNVCICEGDRYDFFGYAYEKAGTYRYSKSNEYMCDSVYLLNLTVLPAVEKPRVSVEGVCTLVSSAAKGNQWFREDGSPVEGATEQKFTPEDDGVYYVAVSNGACSSEPSQAYRVRMTDKIALQMNLAKGWNWVSSNLSDAEYQSTAGFLNPIVDKVNSIEGLNSGLVKENNGFSGSLTAIAPQESYKLNMEQSASGQWNGVAYRPEETPVSLQRGWNWIGYLPVEDKSLTDALSNLSPIENEVVKTIDGFAIYSGGVWKGTLTTMKPGEGYMYYASENRKFTYPVTRVFTVDNTAALRIVSASAAPWSYDMHAYRDNTTMIAELYADDAKVVESVYSVGAFVGDDCRGIGTYIDGLLYLTIHGTLGDNEKISFKAYENASTDIFSIAETVSFDGMQIGTVAAPYPLHATTNTGIRDTNADSFNIYPNPVRNTMFINGDINKIKGLKILDSNGMEVLTADHYTEAGIDVSSLLPDVYFVGIQTSTGYQYKKIVKVN
jgi:hypothetical protein